MDWQVVVSILVVLLFFVGIWLLGTTEDQTKGGTYFPGMGNTKEAKGRSFKDYCLRCSGDGWDADWSGPYRCPVCHGTGHRPKEEK